MKIYVYACIFTVYTVNIYINIVNMRPSQVPKNPMQENLIDKRNLVAPWLGTWHEGQRGQNCSKVCNYSYKDVQSCDKFECF